MGGKYSVIAKKSDDDEWLYVLYTDSFIKFILASIKCFIEYDIVLLGKHG